MSLLYYNVLIIIASHTLTFQKYREYSSGEKNKSKQADYLMVTQHTCSVCISKEMCVNVYAVNTSLEMEEDALEFTMCQL